MYTYQMIGLSDQNGKTYISKYGTYNKKDGFIIKPQYIKFSYESKPEDILFDYQELLNNLFHEDCWSLKVEKPKKRMTKEEIEKVLGYEIDIVSDENGCDKQDKCNIDNNNERIQHPFDELLKKFVGMYY